MPAILERVLLTNVPDFLDSWILKSSLPCGDLILQVNKNPSEPCKVVILTEGCTEDNARDNARKIAAALDNYNFCGSVIRAQHIFFKPPEVTVTKATTTDRCSITADAKSSKQQGNVRHEIQADIKKTPDPDDKTFRGHSANSLLGPPPLMSIRFLTQGMPHNYRPCHIQSDHTTYFCKSESAKANSSTADSNSQEERNANEVQTSSRSNSSEKTPQTTNSRPARGEDETGKLHHDRKRRSSAIIVDSAEKLEDAQRGESTGRSPKTSSQSSSSSNESRSRDFPLDSNSRQSGDASTQEGLCRYCGRYGHDTWFCNSYAEYYKVGLTEQARNPPGYHWRETSMVKVEGLHAGPIIAYIEKCHLQREKMNLEEMRIMFSWLLNYNVCHACGAAGHQRTDGLCKYLPLDSPVTEEMTPLKFCRRMRGIRDRMSFVKLQQCAYEWNSRFSDWLKTKYGIPIPSIDRREDEEHVEKPKGIAPPEPDLAGVKIEGHNSLAPEEPASSTIVFAPDGKRIKTEQPDDYQEYTNDGEDAAVLVKQISRIPRPRRRVQPSGMTQDSCTSRTGETWASSK